MITFLFSFRIEIRVKGLEFSFLGFKICVSSFDVRSRHRLIPFRLMIKRDELQTLDFSTLICFNTSGLFGKFRLLCLKVHFHPA